MPRKGMSICFSPHSSSFSSTTHSHSHSPSPSRFGFSPPRQSFSESVMDRTLDMAEPIIMKWDPQTTNFGRVTSLFYENRREAREFIKTVHNLQKAMHFLVTENSSSEKMVRAQNLMQTAMKRLEKEFYQILSMNRAHLDPESVSIRSSRTSTGSSVSEFDDEDDDTRGTATCSDSVSEEDDASTLSMGDLRTIADCMISSGYAKECLKIYKVIRKSIVDEGIYRLGVEKFTSSHIHKMDWPTLEMRISNWLTGLRTAVGTLFNGERILCDHVFASSDSIRESCFTEITKEGALILFGFPENVAKNSKKSPERVFRILDMYTGICNHWPEIDSIFCFDSTLNIKNQAVASLIKLGEFVRTALTDFESVILKDSPKSIVAGGGVHDLTIDVMKYLTLLADYTTVLSDILEDSAPHTKKPLPESYFGFSDSDESSAPTISIKMAWLILVLLCKIDAKAKHYKEVSLSYLFLANNLQHVVVKVRTSNLKYILGDEWLTKHETKVKQFAVNYERTGWKHVIDCLPADPTAINTPDKVKEIFRKFNLAFDQAYTRQSVCVVPDSKLRDDIKVSIAGKIFRLYREFYNAHRKTMERERYSIPVVRYAPEDVGHYLSDLFFGVADSGSYSSFESYHYSPSPSPSRPLSSREVVKFSPSPSPSRPIISQEMVRVLHSPSPSPSRPISSQEMVRVTPLTLTSPARLSSSHEMVTYLTSK